MNYQNLLKLIPFKFSIVQILILFLREKIQKPDISAHCGNRWLHFCCFCYFAPHDRRRGQSSTYLELPWTYLLSGVNKLLSGFGGIVYW